MSVAYGVIKRLFEISGTDNKDPQVSDLAGPRNSCSTIWTSWYISTVN